MSMEKVKCIPRRISGDKLGGWRSCCVISLFCIATVVASHAQTFTSLVSFDGSDGNEPNIISLIQGTDGDLYGTTGTNVFKITPQGTLTNLNTLTYGYFSTAGLVQATDKNFYGTTEEGGAHNGGTIFKITSDGALTTLYSFCSQTNCTDGEQPDAGLVQGQDGSLYGTTQLGGTYGYGTVFKISLDGTRTTLYSFCAQVNCTDGKFPNTALVQGSDGNFYATAGTTVFNISPAGKLTTIYSFGDSGSVAAALIQATDGNLYGTQVSGGPQNGGSVFRITPSGVLTTIYTFCTVFVGGACLDGIEPYGSLFQATDGNLYGTTYLGGANNSGTIFKLTRDGTLTTLYNFCAQTGCIDGDRPFGGLVQATNGNFYGTTWDGGSFGLGTVFNLAVGLSPFVQTEPTSGREGAQIWILGQGFSSSSVVEFDGIKAAITKLAGTTFISAIVPPGALTGRVTVATGAAKLTSSQIFKVTPTFFSFSPPSGPVGTSVTITGTGFTQATKVTFHGESANFTVNSDTQITTTVPTAATTGKIAVTTKGGGATSETSFTVN